MHCMCETTQSERFSDLLMLSKVETASLDGQPHPVIFYNVTTEQDPVRIHLIASS